MNNANKSKWIRAALLFMMLLLLCIPVSASAATVKLNKSRLTLMKGKTYTLQLENAAGKVTWSTSKRAVATVNSQGVVTAKKKGTAYITAKCNGKKYRCKVTVKQPVTSIRLNQKNIAISVGRSYTLKATVSPTSANNKAVWWLCSDRSIVSISSTGKMTAQKPGEVLIAAMAKDGSGIKAYCKVMVKSTTVDQLKLSETMVSLEEGDTKTLTVSQSGGAKLVWTSNNTSVATVSNGKITAMNAGKALISVKKKTGGSAVYCSVTVTEAEKEASSGSSNGQPSPMAKQFLSILQKYSDQVKADKEAGISWGYSNSGSLALNTWSKAYNASRNKGITYCNCALLARWGLRELGIINNKNFWGLAGGGVQYRGNVKEQLLKYCEIIPVYNKTPNQLIAEGKLIPGDICTWVNYQHTNVYAGDGLWYDSGRSSANGSYVNGTFMFDSFGPNATINMNSTKVGHIIRIVK